VKYETEKQFFDLAVKKGLGPGRAKEYAKFMVHAFPAKSYWTDENYAEEWVDRFMFNRAWSASDSIRKAVLKKFNIKG
jgi:hypothetical protein